MKVTVTSSILEGKIKAIASKSAAHRLLICAAFGNRSVEIICEEINDDISATVRCLSALGAKITRRGSSFIVLPIKAVNQNALLDCGESGSTLRFLLPIVSALGCNSTFSMSGRLPNRPLSPLSDELEAHGVTFSKKSPEQLSVSGKISAGEYHIRGDVSSQFISGLLFALSIIEGESILSVEGKMESEPYVNMTLDALYEFDAEPLRNDNTFIITGKQKFNSPEKVSVEGDWSNAAFALCAGAIRKKSRVSVWGLDPESSQGDRNIIETLVRFGADIRRKGDCFTVRAEKLYGIKIDATNIPDLVPVLAVVATAAEGKTVINGAARLKIKESDRLSTITNVLSKLGADITQTEDGLIINGGYPLLGGEVSSYNDHRIAMSAAVASLLCSSPVTITSAEATSKSYPTFWEDMSILGFSITKDEE